MSGPTHHSGAIRVELDSDTSPTPAELRIIALRSAIEMDRLVFRSDDDSVILDRVLNHADAVHDWLTAAQDISKIDESSLHRATDDAPSIRVVDGRLTRIGEIVKQAEHGGSLMIPTLLLREALDE